MLFHLTHVDPVTYPVDALVGTCFEANPLPVSLDLLVMGIFAAGIAPADGRERGRIFAPSLLRGRDTRQIRA